MKLLLGVAVPASFSLSGTRSDGFPKGCREGVGRRSLSKPTGTVGVGFSTARQGERRLSILWGATMSVRNRRHYPVSMSGVSCRKYKRNLKYSMSRKP